MTRSLVFAGKDFSEFHCWWDGSRVFRKPAKKMDRYTIPFRNGDLFRSQDSFDNVEIVFNCYIKDDYEKNYSDLINWLNSFDNYQKLQNSAEADTFRMAMFHSAVEPETGQFLKDGQFTLTFDCMPQEFLVSGEEEIDASNVFAAYTGSSLTIDNPVGQSSVTSARVYFDPVQSGSGDPSPSNIRPIEGWQSLTLEGNETITEVLTGEELLNYSAWQSVGITGGSATWENDGVTLTSNAIDCYTNYESSVFPTGARIAVSEGDVLRMTWDVEGTARGEAYIFGNGGTSAMASAAASLGVLEWTVPSGVTYVTFRVGVRTSGNTLSYKNISIRKEVTYYGGYVDLVSGVLTVDRVSIIADPSLNWRYDSSRGGFFYLGSAFPNFKTSGKVISNLLKTVNTSAELASTDDCIYSASVIGIKVHGVNTVSDFQTWLTNNSLQVVYEIEPQTVQLTENEISLIYGENQFSTDATSLRIVVEEPAEIENPTLMEAQPIIIINGAGTYYLNGDEIIKTHGSAAQYPTYIDTETMDAYALDSYGNKINQNGYVTLTAGLIKLAKGMNYFYQTGNGATAIPRWWKL